VDAAVAELHTAARAHLVMACGTGKTGVGKAVADELAADTTLVVVPTLELLAQTAREYVAYGYDGRMLAVCSDAKLVDQSRKAAARAITTGAQTVEPALQDRQPGSRDDVVAFIVTASAEWHWFVSVLP